MTLGRTLRLAEAENQEHLQMRLSVLLAMCEIPQLGFERSAELLELAEGIARLRRLDAELAFALAYRARLLHEQGALAEAGAVGRGGRGRGGGRAAERRDDGLARRWRRV